MKLMNNQLESSRSPNSDAMTGCVASTRDESVLEVKTPVEYEIETALAMDGYLPMSKAATTFAICELLYVFVSGTVDSESGELSQSATVAP